MKKVESWLRSYSSGAYCLSTVPFITIYLSREVNVSLPLAIITAIACAIGFIFLLQFLIRYEFASRILNRFLGLMGFIVFFVPLTINIFVMSILLCHQTPDLANLILMIQSVAFGLIATIFNSIIIFFLMMGVFMLISWIKWFYEDQSKQSDRSLTK